MSATLQHLEHETTLAEQNAAVRMRYARLIGALFLAGFLFYGTGFALVESVVGQPDFMRGIGGARTLVTIGVCLMLLNTFVDIGKGVLFYPVLEPYGKRTALVYLAALIVQVVLLDVGALLLLMLVPLGELAAGADVAATTGGLAPLFTAGSDLAYNTGQAVLSFGGIFLTVLLFRTTLIPRALAALGIAGYALHAIGSFAELFGAPISMILLIPGGIFELSLAFWLLVKGFRPAAPGGD